MPRHSRQRHTNRRQRPLVVVSISPTFYSSVGEMLACIREEAIRLGWDLLNLGLTAGALPDERKVGGALVSDLPDSAVVGKLRGLGCPVVRMGTLPHPQDELAPPVLPDLHATGVMGAAHFAERGFRHVAFVGHEPLQMAQPLYEGFRQHATDLGCECHLMLLKTTAKQHGTTSERYRMREKIVGRWLNSLPKPIGVLAYNDHWGARICTWGERAGLQVPGDLAVLGAGNHVQTCEMSPVALSSIDVGGSVRVIRAMHLLHDLMRGQHVPPGPILISPLGVVTRRSTDVLAVEDPLVAEALRWMWEHLAQNMSVDDVALALGCQRYRLERAFRKHLNRGVNAELRRRRVQELARLLRETKVPITDLAPEVGFQTMKHLHRSFRSAYGISPSKYRALHKVI